MNTTLQIVTPPSVTLLMDPAQALDDLGLDSSYTARITRLVSRVSMLMAKELLFDPAYRTVQEGFQNVQGRELLLTGRPLNIVPANAVTRVFHPPIGTDTPDPDLVYLSDYDIRYSGRPSGEGSVFSIVGWPEGGFGMGAQSGEIAGWDMGPFSGDIDWAVVYNCGWWLPTMSGTQPAGVPSLPDDLIQGCWFSVRKLWFGDQVDPNVQTFRKADREVTYRHPNLARSIVTSPVKMLAQETVDVCEYYQPPSC